MPLPAFDHTPTAYTGPTKAEVRALREAHVNPGIFLFYKEPIMITEGKMQYLYDETGRRFLDAFGGIVTVSVGHCHPKVVAALNRQNELLQHTTTIYLHPNIAEYSAKLAATLPGDLKVVYFTNSGSEANDLALLMARSYTESFDFLALRNCYHGGSQSTMGLTSHHTWKFNVPHSFGIHHAVAPDLYRGRWTDVDSGPRYAEDIRETIRFATSGKIAGFIAESIQGVGGAVVFPENYLKEAYRHVREAGGLCVADEVQSGFGRTGSNYWGFETQGVIPDIVTMAKGIGNGFPLGAVVTTPEIAKTIAARVHFNTYGGNPMACAQGKAVLEVIEEEGAPSQRPRDGQPPPRRPPRAPRPPPRHRPSPRPRPHARRRARHRPRHQGPRKRASASASSNARKISVSSSARVAWTATSSASNRPCASTPTTSTSSLKSSTKPSATRNQTASRSGGY